MRSNFGTLITLVTIFLSSPTKAQDAASFREFLDPKNINNIIQPNYVTKALALQYQVDEANQKDLTFLLQDRATLEIDQRKVMERICDQKDRLQKLKAYLDTQKELNRGSADLRTGLVKLGGEKSTTGILDDLVRLIESSTSPYAHPNAQITAQKSLLIFEILANSAQTMETLSENLSILYPAKIPQNTPLEFTQGIDLIVTKGEERVLMIPNSGFVYGGDFITTAEGAKVCRGVDCSSFLSFATNASARLSTMVMEYTARELLYGPDILTPKELKTREDFLANWGESSALNEYEIVFSLKDLKAGDIVLWRWNEGETRTGHAVLFVANSMENPQNILAIEDNRIEDKSIEGIVVRELPIERKNADRYILRRRQN